jgi:septum site-determining protein MinC
MPRREPALDIKSANLPLWLIRVNTTDTDQLKHQLEGLLAKTPDFFSGAPVALGLSSVADSDSVPDFVGLEAFMKTHGMRVAGVVGGSREQCEAAAQAGLGLFPEMPVRRAVRPAAQPGSEPAREPEAEKAGRDAAAGSEAPRPGLAPASPDHRPTLVIDKPVRTGQQIYAEGADLIVLAAVNAGAELIADGNIHVYAPLRGRALAGVRGNERARIFVQSMEAELLSIAGYFQVFEDGVKEDARNRPVQVFLDGARLVLQPLAS